ncbi:MAG: hypothetical protein RLZZ225_277 [Pseudomonadota bacterium]
MPRSNNANKDAPQIQKEEERSCPQWKSNEKGLQRGGRPLRRKKILSHKKSKYS